MPGATDHLPEGAVVITTADIYRQLMQLTQELGELKGAVQRSAEMSKRVDDHETRLRVLERSRWPLPSLALLISLIAGIVSAVPSLQR